MKRQRSQVLTKIARLEEQLRGLDTHRGAIQTELAALRLSLAGKISGPPGAKEHFGTPRTAEEKLAIFKRLFTGRADVFARHWQSQKTGKSGYAPACDSEWVSGVCEKPRVKCGECTQQAFTALTDGVLLDHLRGRHVVGLYPMAQNETCRLLAVDFDKEDWTEDVPAFVETSRTFGLVPAVERSRSGQGAHVWFFFAEPVPARLARNLGTGLITATMGRSRGLSMQSYDRLFPNQDTMPRAGFGNLIALPLQYHARQLGNSVFVDDGFTPHANQWDYLDSLPSLELNQVQELSRDIARDGSPSAPIGSVPGGGASLFEDSRVRTAGTEPVPPDVEARLAQRLLIDKAALPSRLIGEIRKLAAFPNPEFYKRQALRLSIARTPRMIVCAEDLPGQIGLPRGCVAPLQQLLSEHGCTLRIEDHRSIGIPLEVQFNGDLTPTQTRATASIVEHDTGVLVAPPGAGKTVMAIDLIARRARSTLILVHRAQLLEQWHARLSMFLSVDPREIGRLGAARNRLNGSLDVATLQSLVRRDGLEELLGSYGHVVVDECHHVPAVSFEKVMQAVRARYVTGLTATPQRRDGHHPIIHYQLGPIRHSIDLKQLTGERQFKHRLVVRETGFTVDDAKSSSIQDIYSQLAVNRARNDAILNDVISSVEAGRSPIVLTERRDHLELLAAGLRGFARHVVVLRGGMRTAELREAAELLSSIKDDEERVLLATGRFLGEGFDDSRLDTLFLTMPVSWKGTLVQYAGRLHRPHPGKSEVQVHDYVDAGVPMLARMFEKRLKGYGLMGYWRAD